MRVAIVQLAPQRNRKDANLKIVLDRIDEAAGGGAELIVFPECAVSGYSAQTMEEVQDLAEPLDGPIILSIAASCRAHAIAVIFGHLEAAENGRFYNSAVLVDATGVVGVHRKAHIAPTGADCFTTPGNSLEVFEIAGIRVGVMICYEIRFPEVARSQALLGAQAIVVCSNWPSGAEVNPEIMAPARAAENAVHLLAANRCGEEGGMRFIGLSRAISPKGELLASASTDNETMLLIDIQPATGLAPQNVFESGYVVDLRGHRRPDLYGPVLLT